jgi:tellurium resistance protein TerZ
MTLKMTKTAGPQPLDFLSALRVGAQWDTSSGGKKGFLGKLNRMKGVDLDLIAVAVDEDNRPVRLAGLDNSDPFRNGALYHSGDNTTGKGGGDDEAIDFTFEKVPEYISQVVFIVAAYKAGQTFAAARNVSFNVYDGTSNALLGEFMPDLLGGGNACAVARARRTPSGWTHEIINRLGSVTAGSEISILRFAGQHTDEEE